ncbi:ATP-NAD kinase-like domain-containing protein [Lipomyces oligophaga]|uniref:ATP-NAD kinase-like domain-containing protein n=1 Tax=Lipomyces oligophaga TaxID=45792 RepID=UPI0034CDD2BD
MANSPRSKTQYAESPAIGPLDTSDDLPFGRRTSDGMNDIEFDNVSNTSSDEMRSVEIVVDPQNELASRRRRASLANPSLTSFMIGGGSQSGCLLHALLDTERQSRRRSIEKPNFGLAGSNNAIASESDLDEDDRDGDVDSEVADKVDINDWISKGRQQPDEKPRKSGFLRNSTADISTGRNTGSVRKSPISRMRRNNIFSHQMSRRQLADMAFSVRDLSKYLGTLRIKMRVSKVMIVTKIWDHETIKHTSALVDYLLDINTTTARDQKQQQQQPCDYRSRLGGWTVYVEDVLKTDVNFDTGLILAKDASRKDRLQFWSNELCVEHPHMFDLVITLGGDGTVLYTSRLFQQIVPPVLSFNLGSLGFLTKFDFSNYETVIKKLMNEGVVVSLRMRFECTVMKSRHIYKDSTEDLSTEILDRVEAEMTHVPQATFSILNDMVIDRGPIGTMCTAEIYVDNDHLTTAEADGLVIATPTGSTAYSLSAGGSLVHPDIPGMLISPICPHSLSFRPLVVPDSAVLRIGVPYNARTSAWTCFDGKDRIELQQGDYLTISASRFPFPMIQNKRLGSDWFESLSSTLNWNQRKIQRPFDQ